MAQTAEVRERLFTMRMSEEEWTRADAIAKHFGLNLAGAIRMLLKEKAREIDVDLPPPPPSKPASQPRVKAAAKAPSKKR